LLSAKDEVYDLFNWYINKTNNKFIISGDICIIKLRHDEFIKEKLSYSSVKNIQKKDRAYLNKNPQSHKRYCIFVQEFIIKYENNILYTKNYKFNLRNMDSFFYLDINRKNKQDNILLTSI
jgi:hypothetical protein